MGKGKPGPAKGTRPSGRKKGTPNKDKKDLLARIQKHVEETLGVKDWHPLEQLAHTAAKPYVLEYRLRQAIKELETTIWTDADEEKHNELLAMVSDLTEELQSTDLTLANNAAKEVAKYVAPQLKAIEHKTDNEDGAIFQIVLKDK